MAEFQRKLQRFACEGVCITMPVDALGGSKYARLKNIRAVQQGVLQPRDGMAAVNAALAQTDVHSVRRMNDPSPGAAPAWTRVVAAGTKLYTGQAAFLERDTGYSGEPLSLVPFRPERSPQAWMYIADKNKMRKVRADGTDYPMGIAPPTAAPVSELTPFPEYNLINDFESAVGWANGGTAGAAAASNRINTTIARILFDTGVDGWATINPTAADESIQPGGTVIINAGGGTGETVIIEQVTRPISATTISAIKYDVGVTGACVIQLATQAKGLTRNCMLLVGAGGTQEAVRVLSVTEGPDGLASFRCVTANAQAAGGAVSGLSAFRACCQNTHAAAETLTGKYVSSSITAGTGHITMTQACDLSRIVTRPAQPDDIIHISISVDNPANVSEGRILFDCNSVTNDFTQNYFFAPFRAGDLVSTTSGSQTVTTAAQQAVQRDLIEQAASDMQPGDRLEIAKGYMPAPETEPSPGEYAPNESLPQVAQSATGVSQWTELRFRLGDLTRVGTDLTRGLANIAKIRIQLTVIATTVLKCDAWWLGGSFGPNVSATGRPVYYRYRYRSSVTGAKSLPSPATRYGLEPHRQSVTVNFTLSADAQVDKVDVERTGGALNEWHYCGTAANGGGAYFTDDLDDLAIQENAPLETDAYQPFPIVDLPKSGTCDVCGFAVTWASGDAFNTSWARGTQITIDGRPYELHAQPSSTTRLETEQNVGVLTGVAWTVEEPTLLGQPLPVMWGPYSDANLFFAVGDDRNPGMLYITRGNDPDSAPDTYQIEMTSPSERLMSGVMFDARSIVFSSERAFEITPASSGPNVVQAQQLAMGRGLWSKWAICVGPKIWFLSKDGIYQYDLGGGEPSCITNNDLYPLFPHEGVAGVTTNGLIPPDMAATTKLRLSFGDGFVYFDYQGTDGLLHTLVFDTKIGGWLPDEYTPRQQIHYYEEGDGIHSLLSAGLDGILYQHTGVSDNGSAIACQVRPGSFDGGDRRGTNYFGDLMLDLDCAGVNISVQPGWDEFQTTQAATILNNAARTNQPIDLAAGVGVEAQNLGIDITWSSAAAKPKLYSWEPAFVNKPEDTLKRATDWIDLGKATFLQGLLITANTFGAARTVQVQYDGGTVGATLTVNHNGEIQKPYSFTAPFIAHRIRLVPTDAGTWRFHGVVPVGEPSPEPATDWKTQPTTHDLQGWQHVRRGYIAHISTADITFTLWRDGVAYVQTISHGTGAYKKSPVTFDAKKFLACEYQFHSTANFYLFLRDAEVLVKAHGESGGYHVVNPFGGMSRANGAQI